MRYTLFAGCGVIAVAVVIPNMIPHRHRPQGSLTSCKSNLKNIGTGLEMYSTDYSGHYPRNLGLLTPNYLKTIPECPKARYQTYRLTTGLYAPGNTGAFEDFYLVECTGASHTDVSVPRDYPQYNGIEGLIDR